MDQTSLARRAAIEVLCAAQASGALSPDAFLERFEQVRAAEDPETVAAIVADLEPDRGTVGPPAHRDPYPLPDRGERIATVLSSAARRGEHLLPERLALLVVLGSYKLDLREATWPSDLLDIEVQVVLGQIEIIVPPGTHVEDRMGRMMSSVDHKRRPRKEQYGRGLTVRLAGDVVLGQVGIREDVPTHMKPRWHRRLADMSGQ
ncbi:MAG: hypothetical protein ACREMH_01375 [Gemmatimonadales bacterium]